MVILSNKFFVFLFLYFVLSLESNSQNKKYTDIDTINIENFKVCGLKFLNNGTRLNKSDLVKQLGKPSKLSEYINEADGYKGHKLFFQNSVFYLLPNEKLVSFSLVDTGMYVEILNFKISIGDDLDKIKKEFRYSYDLYNKSSKGENDCVNFEVLSNKKVSNLTFCIYFDKMRKVSKILLGSYS